MSSSPTEKPETPLDEAFVSALKDRKFANFFYDTFLNTVIYMPVKKEGSEKALGVELDIKDKFFPYFISFENGRAVPVFDSQERLEKWGEGQSLDYLRIKAHLLLKLLGPSMSIFLNGGTPFEYILTSEIIELLRKSMRPINPV